MDNVQWIDGNKSKIISELNRLQKVGYFIFTKVSAVCDDDVFNIPMNEINGKKCNVKLEIIPRNLQWENNNKRILVAFWNHLEFKFDKIFIRFIVMCPYCNCVCNDTDEKLIHASSCKFTY